ncbi:MAG: hypothetical protein JWP57_1083 [Spirosoma sp.]|nr:hypothetical protein [Spirosoma sp.]
MDDAFYVEREREHCSAQLCLSKFSFRIFVPKLGASLRAFNHHIDKGAITYEIFDQRSRNHHLQ